MGGQRWSSPCPSPCLEQGQLEQVAEGRVWSGFEYLQGGRLPSPSGQTFPVPDHPHGGKGFFMFKKNFLYFGSCPLLRDHNNNSYRNNLYFLLSNYIGSIMLVISCKNS